MPQAADFALGANLSGTAFRGELNSMLLALISQNSGDDPPATTYPNMPWAQPGANMLWRRDNANTAWIPAGPLDAYLRTALAALDLLTPEPDGVPYFTSDSTADVTPLSAFGRSLIDDVDAPTALATLGAVGLQEVWIGAEALIPRLTQGPQRGFVQTPTNLAVTESLDFDTAIVEIAQFNWRMPKSWNEGTVTFRALWTATGGSGGVVWRFQAVACGDSNALDAGFGGAVGVVDTFQAANVVHETAQSPAMTIAGSPAPNDLVQFQVFRSTSDPGDTLAQDARLLGVVLGITTNAGNDA